ncbi:hypothetical protein Pcinc_034411 [Petrolisthes cinctipes]|uniref:DUF885 domain-containing protein n=1 Tax=Petrolisthes cinctipes TaxID=88211 RepID=A0AAE1EQB9_PETCI|nr:hypothetical protein Pcinc_034411 [Petrolisthes cinctipes]
MASDPPPLPHPTPRPDLLALTQDYWHWKTQDYPQFATQVGINDNTAGRLDSYSMKHFEMRKVKCEEFLRRAMDIFKASSISSEDLINLKVFLLEMMTYIENFPYKRYFAPVTFLEGPQHYFKTMVEKQMVLSSYNDYQKLLSRYGEFPRQATEILELMRGNIESGLMPSNWSLIGVVDQLDSLNEPVEDSVFYKPFIHMPRAITTEQRSTLRQQAQERIKHDLLPSFKRIRDFIESEYLSATRPDVSVGSLEGGEEYYLACLKFHTSTNLTPQEIHNLGITEVARIQDQVKKTARELDLEGLTFPEICQALRSDPVQSFSSKEELLKTYQNTIFNTIYPRLPQMFTNIPQDNLTIEGDDNANAVMARYRDPSRDGTRLGSFVINTFIYNQLKRYDVMTLSLHESVPGHHLQSSYLLNSPSTPDFRRHVDYTAMTNAPARFPQHTVFTEGWGLYAEFLGDELGLFKDPYQRMGRHSFELLRASRLVVDTGMHALGWTREKAVDYLLQNTALSQDSVEIEINRYITWPGQACAYKIGEIKIKELRQKAQNALGSLFRLPDFHDTVLRCTGTLKILEDCVNTYIERTNLLLMKEKQEGDEEEETMESGHSEINSEGESAATDFGSDGDTEEQEDESVMNSGESVCLMAGDSANTVILSVLLLLHTCFTKLLR